MWMVNADPPKDDVFCFNDKKSFSNWNAFIVFAHLCDVILPSGKKSIVFSNKWTSDIWFFFFFENIEHDFLPHFFQINCTCFECLQINFMHTHKKVIVSMEKQKITFITGRMSVENFKTVDICALINRGFSLASFSTFKSVAAIIQYLAEKLKQA